MKKIYLWKSLKKGCISFHNDFEWELNKWYKISKSNELKMCKNGFHASKYITDAMKYVDCEVLAKVEVRGNHFDDDDKQCWAEMRIIRKWDWIKDYSVKLAIYASSLTLENFEDRYADDKRPRLAILAAKNYLINKTRSATAAEAAWSAAKSARSAAEAAAAEAWSAAEAARSAAEAEAAAAWSAAEAARSAAAAAWSAAAAAAAGRSAAWSAAWSAAEAAEAAGSAAEAEAAEAWSAAEAARSAAAAAWSATAAEAAGRSAAAAARSAAAAEAAGRSVAEIKNKCQNYIIMKLLSI